MKSEPLTASRLIPSSAPRRFGVVLLALTTVLGLPTLGCDSTHTPAVSSGKEESQQPGGAISKGGRAQPEGDHAQPESMSQREVELFLPEPLARERIKDAPDLLALPSTSQTAERAYSPSLIEQLPLTNLNPGVNEEYSIQLEFGRANPTNNQDEPDEIEQQRQRDQQELVNRLLE